MIEIKQTETFRKWRRRLKDEQARALIASRLDRLAFGLAGDAQAVGQGISELRIHHGPGYRIYFPAQWRHARRPAVRRRQKHASQGHQDCKAPGAGMERMKWLKH